MIKKDIQAISRIALPAMAENTLQMIMGFVDNYLVAQLGLIAVSGVSVATNMITIYQAVFIALGTAVSSLIARARSQEDREKCLNLQGHALSLTLLISLLLGGLSLIFGKELLLLLGTSKAVAQAGATYLYLVGGFCLTLALMTTLGAILRAQGQTYLPMQVSLLTNLVNALLSAVAVFVCHWGIEGVAAATVLSRLVGLIILAKHLPMSEMLSRLSWRPSKDLLAMALPSAGERLMMRAGDVVIVAIIVHFGTRVVAGNAIGETLTQFNYMPGMGVATALVILVAQAMGQGKTEKANQIRRQAYLLSLLFMLAVGLVVYLSGPFLTGLFTGDKVAIQASLIVVCYSFIGGPATAGTLVYTAYWQGRGNAKLPFLVTSFGMWVIRIGLGILLGISLDLGLSGVWLATIADNLFRWLVLAILERTNPMKS